MIGVGTSRGFARGSSTKGSTQTSTKTSTQSSAQKCPVQTSEKSIIEINGVPIKFQEDYTWNGKSFFRPSKIYILDCSDCNLEKLQENLPDSIQKIYCEYNKIKKLPEKLPRDLKYLDCYLNELEELPQYLVDTNIIKLNISWNKNLKNIVIPRNIETLIIDNYQFIKFYDDINNLKLNVDLVVKIYQFVFDIKTKNYTENILEKISKITEKFRELSKINNCAPKIKLEYHNDISLPNIKFKEKLMKNYNMTVSIPGSTNKIEGGSKTVKKNKNPKKINMKKSELQKIALKNKVSLKKKDGTIKKKDELIKSLKLKKLL